MRLALALVLAIIATVHNAGASAQKATTEVRTLSGEWTFSAEGYVMPLVSTVGNLTWHAERKRVHPGGPRSKRLRH